MDSHYRTGGIGYGDAKKELVTKFEEHFAPMRTRRKELANNINHVESILQDGAARAKKVIIPTLTAARSAVGLE